MSCFQAERGTREPKRQYHAPERAPFTFGVLPKPGSCPRVYSKSGRLRGRGCGSSEGLAALKTLETHRPTQSDAGFRRSGLDPPLFFGLPQS